MSQIIITTDSPSFYKKDTIEFVILNDELTGFNFIKFLLYTVNENSEYDILCGKYTVDLIGHEPGKYNFRFQAMNLKSGVYFIGEIEALKQKNWDDPFPMKFINFKQEDIINNPFMVINDDMAVIANFDVVRRAISDIHMIRELNFLSGFGDKSNTQTFIGLIFCRDIYLSKNYYYDNYEIIPYSTYTENDLFDYINKYLSSLGVSNILEKNEREDILYNNPGLVVSFPKIFAKDQKEAAEIAEKEVLNLLKSLALTRDAFGAIAATMIIDGPNKLHYRVYKNAYNGNIIHGDEFGENPFLNRHLTAIIRKNQYFNLLVSLYSEALKENNIEIAYSRFWSILEVMAEKMNFPNKALKKYYLDGTKIGNTQNNNPNIKDKVRELVRYYLSRSSGLRQIFSEKDRVLTRSDDLIAIWHRHRNCMMHSGGCFYLDAKICDPKNANYLLCKKSKNAILKNAKECTIHNDLYFQKLIASVRFILLGIALEGVTNQENLITNDMLAMTIKTLPSLDLKNITIENIGELKKYLI